MKLPTFDPHDALGHLPVHPLPPHEVRQRPDAAVTKGQVLLEQFVDPALKQFVDMAWSYVPGWASAPADCARPERVARPTPPR